MAVDPKLNNAAVLAQRAYNNAVASLATAQQAIATIKAKGGTATAAQTAALTAAQNTVTTSSTAVKSAQMAVNAANNSVAVAAGTTGKAVSPAVDPGAKQQKPYNVQTTTGTGPTLSSSNGLLEIAGATALAMAVANPTGTARLVGSLFSSAKDILGVGGTTSSTTAPPAATNINESVFDPGPAIGNTPIRPASDPSQFPAYDDNGNLMPGFAINEENGGTYYKGFDSTSSPASLPLTPAQQAMLDANEPPGYSQTTVPLSAAEQAMLDANEPPGRNNDLVDAASDPNTNVGADTPRAERIGLVDAASDPNTNVGADTPRAERIGLVDASSDPNTNVGADTPRAERIGLVDAASDPNTNVGADTPRAERIGLVDAASDPNTNVGADTPRAERIGLVDAASDPNTNVGADISQERPETGSLSLDDPYYGLTSAQLQDLGGADPTDPYIRARLGIPQLPGSELAVTPGFGTIKTGIPLVDSALSTLGSLFSFGGKATTPSVTQTGTTTGTTTTVDTSATAQDAAKLLVQTPALTDDEDQNLQNIVGAQGEIVRAEENIQSNNRQILANEEAQAAAQEQQRQAQAIIDENNAELADDNLPDSRRAELEANNAAQRASIAENAAVIDEAQNNIDNATVNNEQQSDSIVTNQGVLTENSDAFTANSQNLNAPVVADNDPETAVDQNFLDANAEVQSETTLTILSEEETNALFDGAEPGLVDSFVEVDETVTENVDPGDDPALEEPVEDTFVEVDETITELTEEQTEALFEAGDPTVVDEFENSNIEQDLPVLSPEEVDEAIANAGIDVDAEIERAAAEGVENFEPEAVDEFAGIDEQIAANENDLQEPPLLSPEEVDAEIANAGIDVDAEIERAAAEDAEQYEATDVNSESDQGLPQSDGTEGGIQDQIKDQNAAAEAAAKANTVNQATLQARYKQPASADWRVRLQLAPSANYLYKAGKDGIDAGILKPLYDTDGVIFPYTPSIETSYNANYEMYDLTHSNFRGYFYKNSRVNDINIRATFTAQDTQEAAYLLAVIHFFRSVTKMFYGAKDDYRGAPPPLTYLSGLGEYQFNQHPCVVSQFNYSLPPDVDYIRANAPNNYGQNMITQRSRTGAIATNAGSASLMRLFSSGNNVGVGANPQVPTPGMMNQNVNNTSKATYVPTKIELSITLLPINTRSQVSTQFNMKDFASGALIKGGFW